ncbi:MAG TPA: flagellar hook-associated protein FlgK [Longimicrobiaceae bacterium]|nr:flagellar hook-associated protein FlgK [Longimicrobiaceae bacterium]
MASLGSILSIARSALQAQQAAVAVASQNIANAGIEGYSRQRLEVSASTPQLAPYGAVGTGVTLEGVTRARDTLLDSSYRDASSKSAAYDLRSSVLSQAEGIFGAPSDTGIGADLDAFWSSWSDLANAPSSGAARSAVVQAGRALASSFRSAANQLDGIRGDVLTRLDQAVDTVNRAAEQVALLNRQIVTAQAGGHQAPDLLDARDRLVDQLSTLGAVRTSPAENGTISVILDGETLVDGTTTRALSLNRSGEKVRLTVGNGTVASPEGSTIGQMTRLLNTDLPEIGKQLDTLANAVATKVNAVHEGGMVYSTDPAQAGGKFFAVDSDGNATARGMALDTAIEQDPSLIAASGNPGGPTDNATALSIAALRDATGPTAEMGQGSFGDFYRSIVTGLAGDTSAAKGSSEVFSTLTAQAETRRQSVSGVSMDEELIHLIQNQHAYTAASRLLTTVDEMMQSLLNV